jgi:nicotinamide mononucleotide transporter
VEDWSRFAAALPSRIDSATLDPDLAAPVPSRNHPRLRATEIAAMAIVAAVATIATLRHWWPIAPVEVAGFVTGGICVWLVVREHVWNWPIGIANNVVFAWMFWHARLFADATLQVIYLVLSAYGWVNWLRGGSDRTELPISRTPRPQWLITAAAIPIATLALREALTAVNGAAPFFDSLTTVLSLVAQYMLCRKQLEHWLLWIAADLIYIPLYVVRGLPLTSALYGVFLLMCVIGCRDWLRTWRRGASA